jgi:stearoyl-CoA desaturase (delta-9 desaturase)
VSIEPTSPSAGQPASTSSIVSNDGDATARRLAYVTVLIPTLGFAGAVVYSLKFGWHMSDAVLLVLMYAITCFGVEGGFHRLFSHQAYRVPDWLAAVIGIAGCMASQGPVLFWAATHRMHHAYTDTPQDPHSPRAMQTGWWAWTKSIWHGHVGWLFTIRRANWSAFVPDLLQNRTTVWVSRHYPVWVILGIALPAALGGLANGLPGMWGGLLWGGLARIFLLDQVTWAVNSLCHLVGTRPYAAGCHSTNLFLLAIPSGGGSWHNNHHAYPALACNDHRPWQLDPCAWIIRLLELVGLARDVRRRHRYPKTGSVSPASMKKIMGDME